MSAELGETVQPSGASQDSSHATAQLLLQQYRGSFAFHPTAVQRAREGSLSGVQKIKRLGEHFTLAGYASVIDQMLQALQDLEEDFAPHVDFQRGLQLLRLVAAPGMGKVTKKTLLISLLRP